VRRDGANVTQTRRLSLYVALKPGGAHNLAVAAVDTRGRRSAFSAPITIDPAHVAPSAPQDVAVVGNSASEISLRWSPSTVPAGRIVGYRVLRDGAPLFQVNDTIATATGLAAAATYSFTVAAVDGQGYIGPESAPVSATTVVPVPSTGSLHAFLLASTGRSFTDLQAHYTSVGTLYPTYFDCAGGGAIDGKDDPLRHNRGRSCAGSPC